MTYTYFTKGVCSSKIELELDGNIIKKVKFTGGCNGNLKALSKIVEGMTVEHIKEVFTGIKCGDKSTSCSDQLAHAITEAYAQKSK